MHKLLFGTAGIPAQTRDPTTIHGIRQVKALGLGCMELEFVQGVNISKEKAREVRKTAQDEDIILTCHGPYYINLNAKEAIKIEQSKKRMLSAAERAWECGAWSVTFHLGFYLGKPKDAAYATVKQHLAEVAQHLRDNGITIGLRAETTGKPTQFGDIDELLHLSAEIDGVLPCIDFAHLHARSGGKENTYEEFSSVFGKVESVLGKDALQNMHIHIAGIAYSEKGERNHLNLQDSDTNYKALVQAWKDFRIAGTVISESPNIEEDALLLQKMYVHT